MVTKHQVILIVLDRCSVLAKILMVTKPEPLSAEDIHGSVLAKILMVTKQPHPV